MTRPIGRRAAAVIAIAGAVILALASGRREPSFLDSCVSRAPDLPLQRSFCESLAGGHHGR